ncbi:MAG: aromatic ring-hydroxylating dioxygenase subunit alpha [Actinomycetota bacterium]|nr:aromatic ring-hydroxylating dioxygenase subunit alpha [Actinomycetota bacterium]
MAPRFPFPIPFGWYQVAFPGDLAPGEVTAVEYWSRELVLWRDTAGAFHLQDAFCPHLGANLAYGGSVDGDLLTCPFHGWKFDGAGACTNIPYSQRTNRKARVRTYPIVERNGLVLAWYHPFEAPPQWEIPVIEEIGDPAWSDFYASSYVIRTIPQEMSENGADPAHFRFVHGTDTVAEVEEYNTDGPCSVMLSKQTYVTPRGVTEGRIDVYNYGPGFSKVWFSGIVDAVNIATTTPIDENTTQVRFNFIVRKLDDEKLTSTVAGAFVNEINKQIQEDREIWEHKTFLPSPALADTDGPILKFRRWYSQFYAEPYEVGAS